VAESYDIHALVADVSVAVRSYTDDRERVEAVKPMMASAAVRRR
jgi:hypothetical protein